MAVIAEMQRLIWSQGATPLAAHILTPALVEARGATVSAVGKAIWYLTVLELSWPVHFGDCGGLPLEVSGPCWICRDSPIIKRT